MMTNTLIKRTSLGCHREYHLLYGNNRSLLFVVIPEMPFHTLLWIIKIWIVLVLIRFGCTLWILEPAFLTFLKYISSYHRQFSHRSSGVKTPPCAKNLFKTLDFTKIVGFSLVTFTMYNKEIICHQYSIQG